MHRFKDIFVSICFIACYIFLGIYDQGIHVDVVFEYIIETMLRSAPCAGSTLYI